MEKVKVFELDFGDTNYISTEKADILKWIESEIETLKEGDELNYSISTSTMTKDEYDNLPEWN